MKKLLLVVVAGLSTMALTGGVAMAGGGHSAKEPIQAGNEECGANLTQAPVIGSTSFKRKGDTVSFTYKLKGAVAKTEYEVELWGEECAYLGEIGIVTTNKKGDATAKGSVSVPEGVTRFFATSYGNGEYNDTPAVTLLP